MQIETPRLLLRDFTLDDVEAMAACMSDERFWRYYEPVDDNEAYARKQVERFVGWAAEEPRSHFWLAIILKDTGALIGDCGLRRRSIVLQDGVSELGYELDPRYWHLGYATEAARAMVGYGFETLYLHRVWAHCNASNEASWRLMERLGMRREGIMRKNRLLRGAWVDGYSYAILREEWAPST